MKIGIDLRPLQKETQFRGIGIYLRQLLIALSQLKRGHTFVFFVEKTDFSGNPGVTTTV